MPLSKFPRPGFPIVPSLFAPYLNRMERRAGRLGDVDPTIWEKVDASTCRRLAEVVVAELARLIGRKKLNLRQLAVPAPKRQIHLDDLELQFRTKSRLEEHGLLRFPEHLAGLTVGRLLGIPSFGVKSVVDFLTSLEHAGNNAASQYALVPRRVLPKNLREITAANNGLPAELLGCELPRLSGSLTLSLLGLQPRTFNTLKNTGYLDRVAELCVQRAQQVLQIRGFGVGSLIDLVECLYAAGGMKADQSSGALQSSAVLAVQTENNFSAPNFVPRDIDKIVETRGLMPLAIQRSRLPNCVLEGRLSSIGLKPRTFNILKRANLIDKPERLAQMPVAEILRLPGCGLESLFDLVDCVYRVGDQMRLPFSIGNSGAECVKTTSRRFEP